jgi:hypothetical protein
MTICPGDSFTVSYTVEGAFDPKNVFSVQLSSADGSFSNFTSIGMKRSNVSGDIRVAIAGVVPSDRYRIRVASSLPFTTGPDNGRDLSFKPMPGLELRSNISIAATDEPIQFSAQREFSQPLVGDYDYEWDFGSGAVPNASSDSMPPPVRYTTAGLKSVALSIRSAEGCIRTVSQVLVEIANCFPAIPADVRVIEVDTSYGGHPSGPVYWIKPGGVYNSGGGSRIFFIEPGGVAADGGGGNTYYIKAGGEVKLNSGGGQTVIYEEGAAFRINNGDEIKCNAMEFDYTNAPKDPRASVRMTPKDLTINIDGSQLSIASNSEAIRSIEIYNILGHQVKAVKPDEGSVNLSLAEFGSGQYIVRVRTNSGAASKSFQIVR